MWKTLAHGLESVRRRKAGHYHIFSLLQCAVCHQQHQHWQHCQFDPKLHNLFQTKQTTPAKLPAVSHQAISYLHAGIFAPVSLSYYWYCINNTIPLQQNKLLFLLSLCSTSQHYSQHFNGQSEPRLLCCVTRDPSLDGQSIGESEGSFRWGYRRKVSAYALTQGHVGRSSFPWRTDFLYYWFCCFSQHSVNYKEILIMEVFSSRSGCPQVQIIQCGARFF